ncbi:hypothetical protein SAMN05216349_105120 [Oribacterium sp. KHPX15]|jgi:hypothetical protein|nr:hypothetical protein SAMN05216349_105120 [Oribacterium sp. KHPX15]
MPVETLIQKRFQGDSIEMMNPKTKKTISAVIVIALVFAMVLTMVLPYILK